MEETEKKREAEVQALLQEAARIDAEADEKEGKEKRGDELPEEWARRESRLKKLREAQAAREAEAKEAAKPKPVEVEARLREGERQEEAWGRKLGGKPPQAPNPEAAPPEPKAQRNFTDPDSRIMKDGATQEWGQAYNAQAVVDDQAQVIAAAAVTQEAHDKQPLIPMLKEVEAMTGSRPAQAPADAGYCSEAKGTARQFREIDLCGPPDRQKQGKEVPVAPGPPPPGAGVAEQIRHKLRPPAGGAVDKRRKAVVEPVFGQSQEGRGFRRFLRRGLAKVQAEGKLRCATHNRWKLFQSGWSTQRA